MAAADPADDTSPLRVIYRRNACGAVDSLEIWRGDALLLDTAACKLPDAALLLLAKRKTP